MKSAAVEHVKKDSQGLGHYEEYHFLISLLGDAPFDFSCVAKQSVDAWTLAAIQANRYNMPCMSITYKGKE